MIKVLVAAEDPGGASTLVPVIRQLMGRSSEISVRALTRSQATTILSKWLVCCSQDLITDADLQNSFSAEKPDVLLTATSLEGTLETSVIKLARGYGVPSLALMDSWTNYMWRFGDPAVVRRDALPDLIAVPDQTAYNEMVAIGFPSPKLLVTGHPLLEGLLDWSRNVDRELLRSQLDVMPEEKLIVFFSQPIAEMHGDRFSELGRGYDEISALEVLDEITRELTCGVKLVVKLHPYENRNDLLSTKSNVTLSPKEMQATELMVAGDVICGMSSILLIQAWLCGIPVVSVQPGLRKSDALMLARAGHIKTGRNKGEIRACLLEALNCNDRIIPDSSLNEGGAAERVASIVLDQIGS